MISLNRWSALLGRKPGQWCGRLGRTSGFYIDVSKIVNIYSTGGNNKQAICLQKSPRLADLPGQSLSGTRSGIRLFQYVLPARRTADGDAGRVTVKLKSDLSGRSLRRSLKTDQARHDEFELFSI